MAPEELQKALRENWSSKRRGTRASFARSKATDSWAADGPRRQGVAGRRGPPSGPTAVVRLPGGAPHSVAAERQVGEQT